MKTKEEVIISAYGKYWEPYKHVIDENGWFDMHYARNSYEFNRLWEICDKKATFIRPIDLTGIENNNGWNCIHNFPIPNDKTNENIVLYFHDGSMKLFSETYDGFEDATHWRFIRSISTTYLLG